MFLALLIVGVGTWAYSGRSSGRAGSPELSAAGSPGARRRREASRLDLAKARRYFNGQYAATGTHPNMSENDLAGVGIGRRRQRRLVHLQAVVIQGAAGGGTASRLLLGGHDLGEVQGQYPAPTTSRTLLPGRRARAPSKKS